MEISARRRSAAILARYGIAVTLRTKPVRDEHGDSKYTGYFSIIRKIVQKWLTHPLPIPTLYCNSKLLVHITVQYII